MAYESGLLGPTLQFLFSRSGWGLIICIFDKFLGDTDDAGPVTTLWNHWARRKVLLGRDEP